MHTIKTQADLPDWFKTRKYKKNLTAIEWYREIRRRSYFIVLTDYVDYLGREVQTSIWVSDKGLPEPLYYLPLSGNPVNPLTLREALYIGAAIKEAAIQDKEVSEITNKVEQIINSWISKKTKCLVNNERAFVSAEYENELSKFYNSFEEDSKIDGDITNYLDALGNPFLYGQAIKGELITIDTFLDDQTILEGVKRWLNDYRKTNGEKAKRPFNQNDFDDWTYFKIREICDLDVWARLAGVRILDKVIANALWPNSSDEISPIDVLRTTSRKHVSAIFTSEIAARLYGQLIMEKGEKFLDK